MKSEARFAKPMFDMLRREIFASRKGRLTAISLFVVQAGLVASTVMALSYSLENQKSTIASQQQRLDSKNAEHVSDLEAFRDELAENGPLIEVQQVEVSGRIEKLSAAISKLETQAEKLRITLEAKRNSSNNTNSGSFEKQKEAYSALLDSLWAECAYGGLIHASFVKMGTFGGNPYWQFKIDSEDYVKDLWNVFDQGDHWESGAVNPMSSNWVDEYQCPAIIYLGK